MATSKRRKERKANQARENGNINEAKEPKTMKLIETEEFGDPQKENNP